MAEGVGCEPGGIAGLCELIRNHAEAVEFDLIRYGLRLRDLGSPHFTWRDFLVIVRRMPYADSALAAEMNPADSPWTLAEHLLAELVDVQRLALWAKTKDGSKNRNRPKPIERPGNRPTRIGAGNGMSFEEMDAWLGRNT